MHATISFFFSTIVNMNRVEHACIINVWGFTEILPFFCFVFLTRQLMGDLRFCGTHFLWKLFWKKVLLLDQTGTGIYGEQPTLQVNSFVWEVQTKAAPQMLVYDNVSNQRQAFESVVELFFKRSIPGALSPVFGNVHRHFSLPDWPLLGLQGWSLAEGSTLFRFGVVVVVVFMVLGTRFGT